MLGGKRGRRAEAVGDRPEHRLAELQLVARGDCAAACGSAPACTADSRDGRRRAVRSCRAGSGRGRRRTTGPRAPGRSRSCSWREKALGVSVTTSRSSSRPKYTNACSRRLGRSKRASKRSAKSVPLSSRRTVRRPRRPLRTAVAGSNGWCRRTSCRRRAPPIRWPSGPIRVPLRACRRIAGAAALPICCGSACPTAAPLSFAGAVADTGAPENVLQAARLTNAAKLVARRNTTLYPFEQDPPRQPPAPDAKRCPIGESTDDYAAAELAPDSIRGTGIQSRSLLVRKKTAEQRALSRRKQASIACVARRACGRMRMAGWPAYGFRAPRSRSSCAQQPTSSMSGCSRSALHQT